MDIYDVPGSIRVYDESRVNPFVLEDMLCKYFEFNMYNKEKLAPWDERCLFEILRHNFEDERSLYDTVLKLVDILSSTFDEQVFVASYPSNYSAVVHPNVVYLDEFAFGRTYPECKIIIAFNYMNVDVSYNGVLRYIVR